jgi:class I fructose-bisphosphate aldolase
MKLTPAVQKILSNYESDNPGTKANLARILMQGRRRHRQARHPAGRPGFEHGPARSFAPNRGHDPHYHFELAIEAGSTPTRRPSA